MVGFFNELWNILVESSLWLLVGFAIAGAVHALIPREWMLKHLSGGGFWPVAKASMLGIPLPLCSCSVIPVAAGLRKQGASKGASAAFAISTPQTGEESIPITWALFGPVYAITRPIVAVITGLVAGLLIDATGKETTSQETQAKSTPMPIGSCCSSQSSEPSNPEPVAETSCCSSAQSPQHASASDKVKIGIKHGFSTMVIDLAGWLSFGLILAALIASALPQDWIANNLGSGLMPKLLMLLVGIPLYICATSSTPLAFSLVLAGLSPGAALVLLLSGPATNVATMSWLIKDLGIRALVIYLGSIAIISLIAGVIFDAFFTRFVHVAEMAAHHEHGSSHFGIKEIAAVLFVMLMAWALGMKARGWMNKKGWGTTENAVTSASGGCCSSTPSDVPLDSNPKPCASSCGCKS
jgi:uncharacterized protein